MRLTINLRMIIEQPLFENFNCSITLKNTFGSISEHYVVFTYLCDNKYTYDPSQMKFNRSRKLGPPIPRISKVFPSGIVFIDWNIPM
jgi:hypothetical protein